MRAGGKSWTLEALQEALDRPKAKVQVALRLLRHQGVVAQGRDGRLTLTRAGLDANALDKLLQSYRHKRESDRAMLERMVFYGQTGRCRWKVLLDNFGESEGFESCGTCDNCVRIAAAFAAAEREREAEAVDVERSEMRTSGPAFEPGELVSGAALWPRRRRCGRRRRRQRRLPRGLAPRLPGRVRAPPGGAAEALGAASKSYRKRCLRTVRRCRTNELKKRLLSR